MTVDIKLMTAGELMAMPDDGKRHELVDGELRTMAPAGYEHGKIAQLIAKRLGNYAEAHKLGIVCSSDTGFRIARNPDSVLCPDVPFVKQERDLDERGYYPGTPDLAVEVISPTDPYTEVNEKVSKYLAAGTPMVVVVDPRKKCVSVYAGGSFTLLSIGDVFDGGSVVPGFKLPLQEIFVR